MNEIAIREQKLYQIKYELDKRKKSMINKVYMLNCCKPNHPYQT